MKKSVNTVVRRNDGKYLLQMRDGNVGICNPLKWNFFGGGMREASPVEAAQREIREELRLQVNSDNFLLVGELEFEGNLVYLVELTKKLEWGDFKIQEGAGAGFFDKDEILGMDATEQTKQLVRKFFNG